MPKPAPVYGHTIAPPRITGAGLRVALVRVALPFLAALTVLDALVALGAWAMGTCFGLWCWL